LKVWESVDCLLAPVTAITAPRVGEMAVKIEGADEDVRLASTRLTRPFSVLGWPALPLPCGLSKDRLPIGLQIVAPPHREKILFQLGSALEDALGFAQRAQRIRCALSPVAKDRAQAEPVVREVE
jgi:aspartyl-tRNA(Asn)/glutamyl-tRNA(Gln) amidotransferase subunit A